MRIRRTFQVACPACAARVGRPCTGKLGETLQGVHFQRTNALRTAAIAAFRELYAPLGAGRGFGHAVTEKSAQ